MKQPLSLRGITSIFRKIFRRRDQHDRETQHEKGHALMESTSKSKALLIAYGASNHMMSKIDSFSSLEIGKYIHIHMGDDSTILSEGQGMVDLENGYFSNVLYVLSLASNILSVYQMTHIGVPKRVSFSPNDVEITDLASGKLIAKGLANDHARAYEFSHFVADAKPTALLTHGMRLVGCSMRGLAILVSNICSNYRKNTWLKAS